MIYRPNNHFVSFMLLNVRRKSRNVYLFIYFCFSFFPSFSSSLLTKILIHYTMEKSINYNNIQKVHAMHRPLSVHNLLYYIFDYTCFCAMNVIKLI